MQVSFDNLSLVTGLVLQGSGIDTEGWVESFNLSYTADEVPGIWTSYANPAEPVPFQVPNDVIIKYL